MVADVGVGVRKETLLAKSRTRWRGGGGGGGGEQGEVPTELTRMKLKEAET